MTFAELTNEYGQALYMVLFLIIVIGLRIGFNKGGWTRHLPYMFTLVVYLQYYIISPYYFYIKERRYIIGTDISEYYGLGAFFSIVGVFFFIFGYWISKKDLYYNYQLEAKRYLKNPGKLLSILFYALYGIVLLNMAASGIQIQNIFLGNQELSLGEKGATYFLQNFADSLITVIVLAYLYKLPTRTILLWTVLSFFLFTLLGFRYRILLSLLGLSFAFIFLSKVQLKQIVLGCIGALLFFYSIMFITANRFKLLYRDYYALLYNPLAFKYDDYFDQTRGALADMAIYKVYDNPNKDVDHDYGASMFAYIFVRMIPRALYENKNDLYPPPQNKIQWAAYDAWWAKSSGEAVLSLGCMYIAFGWLGIVVGSFFWGYLLRRFANVICKNDLIDIASYIVIALVTFQWITRAYFPQAVDHAVYMLTPVWVLRFFSKKIETKVENN